MKIATLFLATVLCLVGCISHPAVPKASGPEALSTMASAQIVRLWPGAAPTTQPTDFADVGETMDRTGNNPSLSLRGTTQPSLSVFLPGSTELSNEKPRTAIIVCAGGGYSYESLAKEGFAIAKRLNEDGIVAFVLKYRLPNGVAPAESDLPMPQQDVLRAVQWVRSHAADLNIDPHRIGVMGFSAGGHLAATAATLYGQSNLLPATDSIAKVSARPDFAVLIYPVISMDPSIAHMGSRRNLLGQNPDEATAKRFSADLNVTADTSPLFIAHAKDDRTVPYRNAELVAEAAQRARVKNELLPIETGGHGFGLVGPPQTRVWYDKCLAWLRSNGFVESTN